MEQGKFRNYVDSSTSAWFKSVMDPAHARDYGCVGIPDENKQPTIVATDRDTFVINEDTFDVNSTWKNQVSGATATNVTAINLTAVTVVSYALPYDIILVAYANVTSGSGSTATNAKCVSFKHIVTSSQLVRRPGRVIDASLTCDVIGQLMYTGGYFETGYFPMYANYTTTAGSSNDFAAIPIEQESIFATRTCDYKAGCYSVHRMNSYDWARVWRTHAATAKVAFIGRTNSLSEVGSTQYDTGITVTAFEQPNGGANTGWDPMFVKYYPSGSSSWVLRVTYNVQTEYQTPYDLGGSDGAKYDIEAVKAYMQICDMVDFTYPSSYNDLKRLINNIKTTLSKHREPIKAVVGNLPYGSAVNAVMDVLLDWDKPNAPAKQKKATKRRAKAAVKQVKNPFLRRRRK